MLAFNGRHAGFAAGHGDVYDGARGGQWLSSFPKNHLCVSTIWTSDILTTIPSYFSLWAIALSGSCRVFCRAMECAWRHIRLPERLHQALGSDESWRRCPPGMAWARGSRPSDCTQRHGPIMGVTRRLSKECSGTWDDRLVKLHASTRRRAGQPNFL